MFSLVIIGCEHYGLESGRIIITGFKSESDAYQHGADLLVDADEVQLASEGFKFDGDSTLYKTTESIVQAWAEGLGGTEYFHVIEERAFVYG